MQAPLERSFNEVGRRQLATLWQAVHRVDVPARVLRVFDLLVPQGIVPSTWPSFIGDDHTPYEFSLLLGRDDAEVRVMAEVLPRGDVTLTGTVEAARSALATLARDHGAVLDRFDAVADLFLPDQLDDTGAAFALWVAAGFAPSGTPSFKVYLNPLVRGRRESARLVEEMLGRLGFEGSWSTVTRALRRGCEKDELRFVSLDLGVEERARVKVYAFHYDVTAEYLEQVASFARSHEAGLVTAFCKIATGGEGALLASRQPGTCLAFVAGEATPRTCTVHVPIRAFAGDDVTAHSRVLLSMAELGVAEGPFQRAIDTVAQRPLDRTSGVVAWAAIRTGMTDPKMNVYLAPGALASFPAHPTTRPELDEKSATAVIARAERESITVHPFFQRLARGHADIRTATLMLLNVREAITRDFPRRLSSVIARIDDEGIRSLLAKQLNDELGNGDPTRTHKILFERFVDGLAEWHPRDLGPRHIEPGAAFGAVQEELYVGRSPYEGLGATLMMEVCGKQFDLFLGEQLRRCDEKLPESIVEWLTLHEELEVAHVDESIELAAMASPGRKAELTARGAEEVRDAGWAFLDAMYRLTYG